MNVILVPFGKEFADAVVELWCSGLNATQIVNAVEVDGARVSETVVRMILKRALHGRRPAKKTVG